MRSRFGSRFFFAARRSSPRTRISTISAGIMAEDGGRNYPNAQIHISQLDLRGIDARQLEVGHEPPHQRGALHRAHARLEQGELVAGVDHRTFCSSTTLLAGRK